MSTSTARWPGLDGLRALAVTVVVGYHFGVVPPGGVVGVDLFFVVSGFLITTLLVEETRRFHRISLKRFWARRALRLGPALFCAIGLALALSLRTSGGCLLWVRAADGALGLRVLSMG
jgi:peptidoglycan/LPS O-acetylase OafA/YrhL